jgi:type VI secretion system secreted protein VgrG
MPTATDSFRIAKAHTPLGSKLVFRQITGREEISRLFEYRLELFAEDDSTVDPKALLGQGMVAEILTQSGPRYINGECVRFAYTGTEWAGERNSTLWKYEAVLRPWLWYLTRTSTCKIFQKETVPDILQKVLGKYPFNIEMRLSKSYRTWNYCVQYQETDFNFVSRMMEHEGIYYWFEHSIGSCTMVMADDMGAHLPLPGYATIPFILSDMLTRPDEEWIDNWRMAQEVDSGKYFTDDYYYRTPSADLKVKRDKTLPFPYGDQEIYDWPGGYTEPQPWGDQYAQTRIEELQSTKEITTCQSNARGLAPGYVFDLTRCQRRDQNRQYLIRAVNMLVRDNAYTTGGVPADWQFEMEAQPADVPYRPARLTPKPHISGPQTAVVTGPKDEEIYTDDEGLGRVKVHFHWDREQPADENSSCWIRVSSSWAGSNWGQISLPRVGQEVIVEYIDGDPDYPIITGRCYNQEHKPPYELPKYKEYSTIKSHSTKKGGTMDWNELRFYDYKGKEQVFIHANWRMDVRVKWNKYVTVKENWHTQIWKSYYRTIGGEAHLYTKGKYFERCDNAVAISAGGVFQTLAESDYQLTSDTKVELNAPTILLEAANSLTLKVGANIVKIDMGGITIQGMMVKINSGGGAGPATPFEFDDPGYANESDDGTPGYLDKPKTGGGGWQRKKRKGGGHRAPITGLGPEIDGVAGRSPKLASNLAQLQKDGWTIKYGEPDKGTFCDKTKKEIVVDPNESGDPNGVTQSLAHESGHALYTTDPYVPPAGLSKEDYVKKNVNSDLKDEGEATMTNAEVRNEILNTDGGPDIGIAGSKADKYDEIAKKYPDPKDRDKARQEIGDVFAEGETPSGEENNGKTYSQYYGETYEKEYDKQAAGK